MKKYAVVLAVVVFSIFAFVVSTFSSDIVWDDIGRGNLNLKTVLVNPDNLKIIYVGSSNAVLKTEDGGETWRNILSIKGQNRAVNFLLFNPDDKNSVYAATGNGLFYSTNQGRNWSRLFKGKNYLENECTTIAVLPAIIYVGTKAGLFVSKDRGRTWHRQAGILGNSNVLVISYNLREPNYIYVACIGGVFKTKNGGEFWEKIFTARAVENNENDQTEEGFENQDEEQYSSRIRYTIIDPNNLSFLYLATSRGIYRSTDRGQSWEPVSNYGLLSQDVRFLLISGKSLLYTVTKSGIFEYKDERWQELSFSLAADDIRFLSLDNQNNLYAACDKGLFKTNLIYSDNDRQDNITSLYFENEPRINAVQQAAIKYAEVEPGKIIRWRKQAARRALLPKITIGMDCDNNRTISQSIWGTYSSNSTPGRYYIGPDDETKYDNNNWSISLTWELGDLIYSDDQTNIDVRSKLMVQLGPLNVHIWSSL